MPHSIDFYREYVGMDGFFVHDSSAVAYVIDPTLFVTKAMHLDVEIIENEKGYSVLKAVHESVKVTQPKVMSENEFKNGSAKKDVQDSIIRQCCIKATAHLFSGREFKENELIEAYLDTSLHQYFHTALSRMTVPRLSPRHLDISNTLFLFNN